MSFVTDQSQSDLGSTDEDYRRQLVSLFRELRSYAVSVVEFFKDDANPLEADPSRHRMHSAALRLHEHLDRGIQPGVEYLLSVACLYDLDQSTKANGYRSFILVIERCCQRLLTLTRYITCHRDSILFRLDHNSRELDAYVTTLGQLRACLYYLHKLVAFCGQSVDTPGRLFPDELEDMCTEDKLVAEQMMGEVDMLCQDTFYGRCLGFPFCQSMSRAVNGINLAMATFSNGYQHDSTFLQLASSVFSGGKYMMDSDCRGRQVVEATRNGDISFCKAFWSLNENYILHKVPLLVCPSVQVDHVFHLEPDQFEMMGSDGISMVTVSPPCANTGPAPVSLRLISNKFRLGQDVLMKTSSNGALEPSTGLIIHCHGGGFVAQSSASHEVYLRKWANDCDTPILCVDYSLAPEQKYPRQLEEVFFAYCWALKNCHLLGSTCKRVCIVGDSAGGTLAVSTTLRALSFGVRLPDGLLSIYGCFLVKYSPSPSRLLSLLDPLLPLRVMTLCLAAYTGVSSESSDEINSHFNGAVDQEVDDKCVSRGGPGASEIIEGLSNNGHHTPECTDKGGNFNDVSGSEFFDCPLNSISPPNKPHPLPSDNLHSTSSETTTTTSNGHKETLRQRLHLNLGFPVKLNSSSSGSPVMRRASSTQVFSTPLEMPSVTDDDVLKTPTSPWQNGGAFSTPTFAKMRHFAQSPVQMPFRNVAANVVCRDPFMSPLLAGDEMLNKMCPVYLVTCHLDPMLDDSISLAQRLRRLGRTVHCDVLDGLPHGFLNFVLVSPEAKAGSELCIRRLRQILHQLPESSGSN